MASRQTATQVAPSDLTKSSHSPQAHFPLSIPGTSLPIFKFSPYNHTPRNQLLCAQMNVVISLTLPVCCFHFRLFLSWTSRAGGGSDVFVWVFLHEGSCINPFQEVGAPPPPNKKRTFSKMSSAGSTIGLENYLEWNEELLPTIIYFSGPNLSWPTISLS